MQRHPIKEGQGALIGNAGEHYVMGELLKRGWIAGLAPRNAPAFDIIATRADRVVRIRVKTKRTEFSDWQWTTHKDGKIFRHLDDRDTRDFLVLVNMEGNTTGCSEFFVLLTHEINRWLEEDFETWRLSPGPHGRKHSEANRHRSLKHPEAKQPYFLGSDVVSGRKDRFKKARNNWAQLERG